MTTTDAADSDFRKSRRRRIGALLAGGLVLGVGATATLAAWTDREVAVGTFGTGTFDLEGSLDGTTFNSNAEDPGSALSFGVDAAALTPGDTVFAPFALRLSPASTYAASVSIDSDSASPIADGLTFSLIETTTFGCDASTPGTTLLADAPAGAATELHALDLTDRTPRYLCFAITADDSLAQGATGSVVWRFSGVSEHPLP